MNTKLKLPSGATGFFNDQNEWVCNGSQIGRRDRIPSDRAQSLKMRLIRLPFVDGDYDKWGAYWGSPATVYIAQSEDSVEFGDSLQTVEMFVRGKDRNEAKQKVRSTLPNARFYR